MINQGQKEWNFLGHWFTTSEASVIAVMIAAVIGGIVSIFAGIQYILLSILALLLAITWYLLAVTRQMQMSLEAGKVDTIKHPEDIFRRGIVALEKGRMQGGWEKVRIYAPVGLWDPSAVKDDWLKALKSALEHQEVRSFSAVYALPQDAFSFRTYAKSRLELFKDTPHTEVHYLPPEDDTHPTSAAGLGAIIFADPDNDRYEVIFAFVGQDTDGPMVRSGFIIRDKCIGRLIDEWFTTQILHGKSRNYVLRGLSSTRKGQVNFATALADIEQEYYPSSLPIADMPAMYNDVSEAHTGVLITQAGTAVAPADASVTQERA